MRLPIFAFAAIFVLSGCNTMFQDSYQKIMVITPGVENADCTLTTEFNKFRVMTPRRVIVERDREPLTVVCEKANYYTGSVTVTSKVRMVSSQLNVFNGILPGTAYDIVNNSIFDYPETIVVTMRPMPVIEDPSPAPYILKMRVEEQNVKPLPLVVPLRNEADESFKKSLEK